VLRTLSCVHRRLSKDRLLAALNTLGSDQKLLSAWRSAINAETDLMQVDISSTVASGADPEIHVYLGLLVIVFFHDAKMYSQVSSFTEY
jgi:hypothetical protein